MVCDVRLAFSTTYFCLSEVKMGLFPAMISKYLIREWGMSLMKIAMMTGRRIRFQTIYEAGLIHVVASDMGFIETVLEDFLEEYAKAAPYTAALNKTLTQEAARGDEVNLGRAASEVFDAILAPGSESSYGVTQFKCGIKNIVCEDRGVGSKVVVE